MKSNTKITKQTRRKTNPELVKTILNTKKSEKWRDVARILSGPRRSRKNINLDQISENSKSGDTIVVPGKILSLGNIDKKIRVVGIGFSEKAKEKLLNAKCEINTILEEIQKNPKGEKIKILK